MLGVVDRGSLSIKKIHLMGYDGVVFQDDLREKGQVLLSNGGVRSMSFGYGV